MDRARAARTKWGGGLTPYAKAARWVATIAGVSLLAMMLWRGGLKLEDRFVQIAGYSAIVMLGAAWILMLLTPAPNALSGRVMRSPLLRQFGKYSYALYLFHVPVRRYIRDTYFPVADFPSWLGSPFPGQLLFYVVATLPAFALAWASWHLYEKQVLKLKARFPYGTR